MTTKKTFFWSVLIALVIGGFTGYYIVLGASGTDDNDTPGTAMLADAERHIMLYTQMRTLWAEHVFWTREYMIEAVAGSPNTDTTAARLMKNQEEIGEAFTLYYGMDAGEELTTLLKEHIMIATELIAAGKANNEKKFKSAGARWQTNASQIAEFLSEANPHWPKAMMTNLMLTHLTTTIDELSAIVSKKYGESVIAFDAVIDHAMGMADALSRGIIKQFPARF